MNRVLFLENNTIRQKSKNIDFSNYQNLTCVFGNESCNEILEKFESDKEIFEMYETLIIHESIYYDDKREVLFEALEEYCADTDKYIVRFSGSHSQSSLSEKKLSLNDNKLYENIEEYLSENENNEAEIAMLAYGKKWDINMLLNTLEKINLSIENKTIEKKTKVSVKFKKDYNIYKLKILLPEEDYIFLAKGCNDFKGKVSLKIIDIFVNNLQELIQRKANA